MKYVNNGASEALVALNCWAAGERLGWYFFTLRAAMEWLGLKMLKSKQLGSGYLHTEWLASG